MPPDPVLPPLAGDDLLGPDGEPLPPGPSLDELYPPEADDPMGPEA